MSTTRSRLEAELRAAAERRPRYTAVALTIAAVYAVSVIWGAGYGVGRFIAQNPPPAAVSP